MVHPLPNFFSIAGERAILSLGTYNLYTLYTMNRTSKLKV